MVYSIRKIHPGIVVFFDYTNHEGVTARRRVAFIQIEYGMVEGYYPKPTFLFHGKCLDREALRSFDITKMKNVSFQP